MRLLFLTPGVFDKGGISRYNRFQIRALRDYYGQDNVVVLSLIGPDGDSFEDTIEVDWHGGSILNFLSRIQFSLCALRYVFTDRPNVILTGHLNLGPLGWLCSFLAGGILVQNIYGREVWSEFSIIRHKALAKANAVISDCINTADYSNQEGLRNEMPFVVWDCVDTASYTPGKPNNINLEQYGIGKQGKFRLMFLGRLHASVRYKGTERILRLLANLSQNFECVIAGGGDDVDHLQGLADSFGVADRTYFPGRIHEDHMPDIYRSADAFYLVSEVGQSMGEGLPLTPIEAMACGVPVIVGNQDGSREILNGSGGGICVSLNHEDMVIDYVQQLSSDTDFARSEGKKARQRVEIAFSYEIFSRKTIRIIEDIKRKMKGIT